MIQILGRARIKELPAFVSVFSTRGAQMRKKHGCRSAALYRVAENEEEVVLLFDWESKEAFQGFLADPEVKETMKSSGTVSAPEFTYLEEVAKFRG